MNLLAFIVMVICAAAVAIVVTIPDEVWAAVAERIRNPPPPRPTYLEELHRHWEEQDRNARSEEADGE